MTQPRMVLSATVLGTPDPAGLARFQQHCSAGGSWRSRPAGGDPTAVRRHGLSFQREPEFEPPVWPRRPGRPQLAAHLDIAVDDLAAAVALAVELGATVADHQPQPDVKVMHDPTGHVFDLFPSAG